LVEDNDWFFDTELLVVTERAGLRIHEVPVDWVDDPDSRVDIVRSALDDVRGLARLGRNLLALLVTAVGNTAANRRFTFGVTGPRHAVRHQLQGSRSSWPASQ
jgi:hypothetical protein